jgi:hypothetical protein
MKQLVCIVVRNAEFYFGLKSSRRKNLWKKAVHAIGMKVRADAVKKSRTKNVREGGLRKIRMRLVLQGQAEK